MRFTLKSVICFILLLLSFDAFAAKDPVTWKLDRAFQNPVFTGRNYVILYTFTSQLPFTMVKPMTIQKIASPANEFSYVDNCSGKKLAPHQSCTVQATLSPTVTGTKSLQLAITGYDNNYVTLPTLTTQTQGLATHQTVGGSVSQALFGSSQPAEAQNYILTFKNSSIAAVTNVTVGVTQTSGTPSFTSTCGSTLAAGQSCSVSGTYTPSSATPTVQSVTATLTYGSGTTSSITTSTTVSAPTVTGVVGTIVGNYYLPAVMVGGPSSATTIWFIFTNNGPGANTVTTSGTPIALSVGSGSGTITNLINHCSGVTLNPTNQCDMQATFTGDVVASPTPVTATATVSYAGGGSTATVSTNTTIVASLSTSRTLTFVNNCNFQVWFSLNGGQLTTSPSCTSDAQCPTGSSCSTLTNLCFWKNYTPNSPGSGTSPTAFSLAASGGTNTVTIPATGADPSIQWSGNISASLGCDGSSSCTQADCGNAGGSTACLPGKGFTPPATQAEITMELSTSDSYDVETINGFHIPISMAPTQYTTPSNYSCGEPGAYTPPTGFGACDWSTATPPGTGYYWVTPNGASCNIATATPTSCGAGLVCGLDSNLNQSCGSFLGYWSADQVCSMNTKLTPAVSSYFQCGTSLASLSSSVAFPANSILYDLMACSVPKGDVQPTFNSCYLTYSGTPANNQLPCCGCIDWWTVSGIGANANTESCTQSGQSTPQTDPVWNQYLQNTVSWMKKSCPSDYTYPFDDKTSGFSCTDTLPGQSNSTSYTITFCAGTTGKPSSINDGRV